MTQILKIKSDFLCLLPPDLLLQEYQKRGSDGFYIDTIPRSNRQEQKPKNQKQDPLLEAPHT